MAGAQMGFAIYAPAKLYKLTTLRKQTRNSWARDDPAVAVALALLHSMAFIAWSIAYGTWNPVSWLWLAFKACVHVIVGCAVIATACWYVANKHLKHSIALPHTLDQEVEWLFAWDVACNASVALLVHLHVVPMLLAPLLLWDSFVATVLANLYLCVGVLHFWYVVVLGFMCLPFLQSSRVNLLLVPAVVLCGLLVSAIAVGLNVPRLLVGLYFI